MKQLLEQLQQFPKTWERLRKFTYDKGFFCIETYNKLDYGVCALLEKLLLDFCDGEGYYVTLMYRTGVTNGLARWTYRISQELEVILSEHSYNSRQEAFNQGVVKSFELMEQKEK